MTVLVGKAKGTISYRREALCVRIFGRNLGAKVIDDIIQSFALGLHHILLIGLNEDLEL